jgi:hypothetical protein
MISILLTTLILTVVPVPMHDVHVSICDVKATEDGTLEFTFKIFFDDLQRSMGLIPGIELEKQYKGSETLINNFLKKNIKIILDDSPVTWTYVKSQASMPAVWTIVTIKPQTNWKKMDLYNSIMTDLYGDQINIVNIKFNNKKVSFHLDAKEKHLTYIR